MDDVRIEPIVVRRHGSHGQTIVVLHGGPGALGSAATLARALSSDFQVLEPLQRRSGRVPLTVQRHVEDLVVVAPKPAIVVGWSWGAMLGLSYAAREPSLVSKLVLVGCGTYDEASRALLRKARATQAESFEVTEEDVASNEQVLVDEAGHVETWNDVLRQQREGLEPQSFRNIQAPVLMIHGDTDPHPGAATRDVLRRFIGHLEYVELERCGHEPWRERHAREAFLKTIRAWLCGR